MCWFAWISSVDNVCIKNMSQPLLSRAIDGQSFFFLETELSFFHAHLKISDLHIGASQPYVTDALVVWLVWEIYNKQEMLKLCNIWEDAEKYTELEVIGLCYNKLGVRFIDYINGEFSIFIFDRKSKQYYLFRDRYGVHAIYFRKIGNTLYFASEIKSLLFTESPYSQVAIAEYLTFGFTLSPHTLFEDISILPPGKYLEYKSGSDILISDFWPFILEKTTRNFIDVFQSAVIRRIPKYQNKILIPLSGWKDSNLVLFFLKKHFQGKIITYSFLNEWNYEDVETAEKNAKIHNVRHIIIDITKSIFPGESDFYLHEWIVQLYDIIWLIKDNLGEDSDVRVEFSWDGREEFFCTNSHFDYKNIIWRYRYFLSKRVLDSYPISHEFLNHSMFDFNLQLIEKITLRNGIERRLPFTDYELLWFRWYKSYREDTYQYLTSNGISIVPGRHGHNQWSGFQYGDMNFLKKHIPKYLEYLTSKN